MLQSLPVPNSTRLHSLVVNEESIFVSDFDQNSVHHFNKEDSSWSHLICGDGGKHDLQDGVTSSARLYEPQGLSFAGKSLVIADSGNGAIRLVTNGSAMVPLLECIREYLASFNIPKQEQPLSLDRCEKAATKLSALFEEMALENHKRSTRGFKGEGPDGNVSEVNRSQLRWIRTGIKIIRDELTALGHADLIKEVDPVSLMELVAELFFTNMRKNNPMPSVVEYWYRRSTVTLETQKRRALRRWHYYTGVDATHYPIAEVGSCRVPIVRRGKTALKTMVDSAGQLLRVKEQRAEMALFQREFGAGAKQIYLCLNH